MLFKENIDNFSADGVGNTISVKAARTTHPVLKHVISHFFSSKVTGPNAVLSFDAHMHDGTWADSGMAPVNIRGSGSGTLSRMTNSGIISSIRPSGSRYEQRKVPGSDPSDPYLRSPAFYSFLEAFRAFRKFEFQSTNLSCAIGAAPTLCARNCTKRFESLVGRMRFES